MKEIKNSILKRVYILYFFISFFSLLIVGQILRIQLYQGDYWKKQAKAFAIIRKTIEASKGNIYADDGKQLLATTIPVYELRLNACSKSIKDKDFEKTVVILANKLSSLFKDKTPYGYLNLMNNARKDTMRGGYLLLKKDVTYEQIKKVKEFPKFKSGRIAVGIDIKQENKRVMPYDMLAKRTVGFVSIREIDSIAVKINGKKRKIKLPEKKTIPVYVGIEGFYTEKIKKLVGKNGTRLERLASGGGRLPLYNDSTIVEPKNGLDLVTTINIDLQEVAQNSLMEHLRKNKADHGCAILMEVATGQVKAIVNLKRDSSAGKTTFTEAYNYAIGESANPGSTFKLASLLVALEDKVVDTNTRFETGFKEKKFGAKTVSDAHPWGGIHTVKEIFEHSSNIGTVTVIWNNYHDNPEKFIAGLYKLRLQEPLGLAINSEKYPDIKDTKNPFWHTNYSLPSMAFGYEVEVTPLQTLTLYNAIANNGRMVRPMFVREVRDMGKPVERYYTTIIKDNICSKETIGKLRKMMEGVVERGTGKGCFKTSLYTVAGKTGTAQINYISRGVQKMTYRASFVGYFPADKPRYSCIVVITNPKGDTYYGGTVAAPVFKDIADKVYSTLFQQFQTDTKTTLKKAIPATRIVNNNDLSKITGKLFYPLQNRNTKTEFVLTSLDTIINIKELTADKKSLIPNVIGMGLKDGMYILENSGFKVKISGRGIIRSQKMINPKEVKLELS